MLHSKIEKILTEVVAGNEELQKLERHFHSIESEIDGMAKKSDADLDDILKRAKVLIERLFGGVFMNKNWSKIEDEIEENLRELKK